MSGADLAELLRPSSGEKREMMIEIKRVIREEGITVPILLMGYVNPVLQFGVEAFCQKCQEVGIDGLILPDMPASVYEEEYKATFDKYGILNIFLITPQTTEARISRIDEISNGFIYMVSSASVTGGTSGITDTMETYFNRVNAMNLRNPRLIGFGIKDNATFTKASQYAAGAIIGSQFIRVLQDSTETTLHNNIVEYVKSVKG